MSLLTEKKTAILEKWFSRIIATYPPNTATFLFSEKDPFSNPVGSTIRREIGHLFEALLGEMKADQLAASLDGFLKIRAVQDFSASQAVAPIFFLKEAIEDELEGRLREPQSYKELLDFHSHIDKLALMAFTIYTNCREKIHEIRMNQLRNQSMNLMDRVNKRKAEYEEAPEESSK